MKKYESLFLYDEIIQQILKHAVNESLVDKIYKNFDNEFLLKIKEKETKNNNVFGGDIAKILSPYPINNFIESGNKNDIAKYYNFKFNILDKETYEYINMGNQKILAEIKKIQLLIINQPI